jgi:Cysteine sulfinate desulfinase/cysteine desulfurase and related enzymes
MDSIYLDYAATTPLDPQVLESMAPYFTEVFGNPSSSHYFGQKAEGILEECRAQLAAMLGARPSEVIFTASGSEGDNLALRGSALQQKETFGKDTLLISPVEHPAVANTARQLQEHYGFNLVKLRIDNYGKIDLEDLINKINNRTAMVSAIYANNEIGTINPVHEIGQICAEQGVSFHTDAVQACAHLPLDVTRDQIGLLNIAAHKFYGPKGVGALIKRQNLTLLSHTTGGKQEDSTRAGTHNVPGIVGMVRALQLALADREGENKRLICLRDRIIQFVESEIPGSHLTGHPQDRLPNHASFIFDNVNGNDLVIMLDMAGFACSSGSACKVGDPKPSEVLLALGLSPEKALGSLRITLGKYTTLDQIERFLEFLPVAIKKLRK